MVFFRLDEDESITRHDGAVIHFGLEKFQRDIVNGDCCFLCAASPEEKDFNDEHVIPDWILRYFNLHNSEIVLPNGFTIRYSRYKVPCCAECNEFLGREVEDPISNILKEGYQDVHQHLTSEGPWKLFAWMNLLFLKTHLKDRILRNSLDQRVKDDMIGDRYDWATMHHIYCVVRAYLTKILIDPKITGSLFLLPAKHMENFKKFDYGDLYQFKTVNLVFEEIALICVLDDACGVFTSITEDLISRIDAPLSPLQLRELHARIAYANTLITSRPIFGTKIHQGEPIISVDRPKQVEWEEHQPERYGEILYFLCGETYEKFGNSKNKDFEIENLKKGTWSFLFDEHGDFVRDSIKTISD